MIACTVEFSQSWSACSAALVLMLHWYSAVASCQNQLSIQQLVKDSSEKGLWWSPVYRDFDFTQSFSFVFLSCFSACILPALSSMCLITTWLSSQHTQEPICEKSVPSCFRMVGIFGMCVLHSSSTQHPKTTKCLANLSKSSLVSSL